MLTGWSDEPPGEGSSAAAEAASAGCPGRRVGGRKAGADPGEQGLSPGEGE